MLTFEEKHPFRVPISDDGTHVRFASIETAADSALAHRSVVIEEHGAEVREIYDNEECRRIHNARRGR
jgi:hypothetical protein